MTIFVLSIFVETPCMLYMTSTAVTYTSIIYIYYIISIMM